MKVQTPNRLTLTIRMEGREEEMLVVPLPPQVKKGDLPYVLTAALQAMIQAVQAMPTRNGHPL